MANSNQTHLDQASSTQAAQRAAQDAKRDIGQDNALADTPPEFSVNNRDHKDPQAGKQSADHPQQRNDEARQAAAEGDDLDPTDAGYDETVANDPVGGFAEADLDDLIETERENMEGGVPTLTPSPTARADEDPSALPESNVAGEAPTQSM